MVKKMLIKCDYIIKVREQTDFSFLGHCEATILFPVLRTRLPANMETVERHCEDAADDMAVYTDSCGNHYDYGFGLNV